MSYHKGGGIKKCHIFYNVILVHENNNLFNVEIQQYFLDSLGRYSPKAEWRAGFVEPDSWMVAPEFDRQDHHRHHPLRGRPRPSRVPQPWRPPERGQL
jgi:hypothetical protein